MLIIATELGINIKHSGRQPELSANLQRATNALGIRSIYNNHYQLLTPTVSLFIRLRTLYMQRLLRVPNIECSTSNKVPFKCLTFLNQHKIVVLSYTSNINLNLLNIAVKRTKRQLFMSGTALKLNPRSIYQSFTKTHAHVNLCNKSCKKSHNFCNFLHNSKSFFFLRKLHSPASAAIVISVWIFVFILGGYMYLFVLSILPVFYSIHSQIFCISLLCVEKLKKHLSYRDLFFIRNMLMINQVCRIFSLVSVICCFSCTYLFSHVGIVFNIS